MQELILLLRWLWGTALWSMAFFLFINALPHLNQPEIPVFIILLFGFIAFLLWQGRDAVIVLFKLWFSTST